MIKAILFGSIGTLVETSEIQRIAFNQAFAEARLGWFWGPDLYRDLLRSSGGEARIQAYAAEIGEPVDADALHRRKSEIFQTRLREGVPLRPGVSNVIDAAGAQDIKLGFATTTALSNVEAVLDAADLSTDTFDFIGHSGKVSHSKPAPDIYEQALSELGIAPDEAIAIEDSAVSATSPQRAGIPTLAFPGTFHRNEDFGPVLDVTEVLSQDLLDLPAGQAA